MHKGKIFCTGLSRTGTSSLHLAMVAMGIASVHYPSRQAIAWIMGDYSDRTTQGHQAFSDIPVGTFLRELDEKNPGAKFIHTTRNPERWLKSVEKWFAGTPAPSQFSTMRDYIRIATYGTDRFQKKRFAHVFEEHEGRVARYFRHRPGDLLTIDLDEGLDWEPVASFLGVEAPRDLPFPRAGNPNLGPVMAVSPKDLEQRRAEVRGWLLKR